MNKKLKLTLNRETLKSLNQVETQEIAGGATGNYCNPTKWNCPTSVCSYKYQICTQM